MLTIRKNLYNNYDAKDYYFIQSKAEAMKITWPAKPEVITTTIMVFIFVLISSIFFLLVDVNIIRRRIHFVLINYVKLVHFTGLFG